MRPIQSAGAYDPEALQPQAVRRVKGAGDSGARRDHGARTDHCSYQSEALQSEAVGHSEQRGHSRLLQFLCFSCFRLSSSPLCDYYNGGSNLKI